MTPDTLILAAVIAFFGVFGVTLFLVSVWSNMAPAKPEETKVTQARRPSPGKDGVRPYA